MIKDTCTLVGNGTMLPNVESVSSNFLCTGCGICQAMCKQNAIRMTISKDYTYAPEVLREKCIGCGLCIKVCSGYKTDYDRLRMSVSMNGSENLLLGSHLSCYIGYSRNPELRWNASSGGVITSLLTFAFKEGLIDGAVVTVKDPCNPLRPKAILARSADEVLSSKGSKYCPVTMGRAMRQVLEEEGKFAVVGLPCHIHSIRNAEIFSKTLREHLVLHLGLFCSNTGNFEGTQCLLKKINVDKDRVISIDYRGNGWPGEMVVQLVGGKHAEISYPQYWDCLFGSNFFTPWRCFFCIDATNELADVSVGDPWLPESKEERHGKSIIVARTKEAETLLRKAAKEGNIGLSNIGSELVKQSQWLTIKSKKWATAGRMDIARRFGRTVPMIKPLPLSGGFGSDLCSVFTMTPRALMSYEQFSVVLRYVPFPVLKAFFKLMSGFLLAS